MDIIHRQVDNAEDNGHVLEVADREESVGLATVCRKNSLFYFL
jgi:hypothetical protein